MATNAKNLVRSSDEVVLFSGGMDSLITWEAVNRPDRLYVNLGHKYAQEELKRVMSHKKAGKGKIVVFDMDSLGTFEEEDANLPLRNLYLAMAAVNLGYSKIWLTVQKDEMSIPDRSAGFLSSASSMLSHLSGREVSIDSPFKHKDKVAMVRWYLDSGKSLEALEDTWACYTPEWKGLHREPCGNCPACFRRYVALILNGVHESWFYKLRGSKIVETYADKARSKHYSVERNSHILTAIKMLNGGKTPV